MPSSFLLAGNIYNAIIGHVAELVDALASGASLRKEVEVQVFSCPQSVFGVLLQI